LPEIFQTKTGNKIMIQKARYVNKNSNIISLTLGEVYEYRPHPENNQVVEVKTNDGSWRSFQKIRFEFIEVEETYTIKTAIYRDKVGLLFALPSRNHQMERDGCEYLTTRVIEVVC
jgi:hypothetical protein